MLARPYLIMLFIIFPIHVNFPVLSRCVIKATIHKKTKLFYITWEIFFFKKNDKVYDIVNALFYLINSSILSYFSCFFIYLNMQFFLNIIRDFSFNSFPLIYILSIQKNYFFNETKR